MNELQISKEKFLTAIVKEHFEILKRNNIKSKKLFKLIVILLSVLFLLIFYFIVISKEIIGITASRYIFGFYLTFGSLAFYLLVNYLREVLLETKNNLKVLREYEEEVATRIESSQMGFPIPSTGAEFLMSKKNLNLSEMHKEFQSLISFLDKYLPNVLNEEDSNLAKKSGMRFGENKSLFSDEKTFSIYYWF